MKIDIILNEFSTPAEVKELGLLAESLGLRAIWSSSYVSQRDPFMTLCPLAEASKEILMGPLAISPYETHPLKMANALHTLNEMSGGRAGIFVGGGGGILRGMRIQPERRLTGVRECVEILKQASAEHMLQYEGDLYGIRDYQPDWATSQPPQIYVAASAPRMLQLATKHADGLMMSDIPLERLEERMTVIRDGLAQNERDPNNFSVNNFWAWHVKKDKDASIREARRELVWRGVLETWYLEPYLSQSDCELVRANFNAFRIAHYARTHIIEGVPDRVIDPLIENLSFLGDMNAIDGIIDRLKQFEKGGLTDIALRVHDDQEEAIRIIGEAVAPALA